MTSILIAHCGTTKISRDELRTIPAPPATATHKPIPHFDVVQVLIETPELSSHPGSPRRIRRFSGRHEDVRRAGPRLRVQRCALFDRLAQCQ